MERLLIFVAVLICVSAGVGVLAMAARSRRAPLRMDSELDEVDEDLLTAGLGARESPIDRRAQVIDVDMIDAGPIDAGMIEAQAIEAGPVEPRRDGPWLAGPRGEAARIADPDRADPGRTAPPRDRLPRGRTDDAR